jgi:hypothetical protein
MITERLTLRLESRLRQSVIRRAKADKVDQSEIVRRALEQYLTPPESAHAAFKKAGLIGVARKGPRDLSSNKKHMEGFGRSR